MVSFIVLLPSSVQPNVNYVVKLKLWLEKSSWDLKKSSSYEILTFLKKSKNGKLIHLEPIFLQFSHSMSFQFILQQQKNNLQTPNCFCSLKFENVQPKWH